MLATTKATTRQQKLVVKSSQQVADDFRSASRLIDRSQVEHFYDARMQEQNRSTFGRLLKGSTQSSAGGPAPCKWTRLGLRATRPKTICSKFGLWLPPGGSCGRPCRWLSLIEASRAPWSRRRRREPLRNLLPQRVVDNLVTLSTEFMLQRVCPRQSQMKRSPGSTLAAL